MNHFNPAVQIIPDAPHIRRGNHDRQHPMPATATVAPSATPDTTSERSSRATWALWGALAGVSGAVATLLTKNPDLEPDVLGNPARTIAALDHSTYQVGVAAGLVTVAPSSSLPRVGAAGPPITHHAASRRAPYRWRCSHPLERW